MTQGSALVHIQTASVQRAPAGRRLDVGLVEVETTDDRAQDELIHRLGKTGAFIRVLDGHVLNGEVDAVVHSAEDMPTERPADLVVVGVPERAPADDVLVTAEGHDIDDLLEGAVVGTSSLRRQIQLLSYRDDLEVGPLRGDIDTHIKKLLTTYLQREHEAYVENNKERQGKKGKTDHGGAFDETTDEWSKGLTKPERQTLGRQVETRYDAIVLAETGLKRNGLAEKVNYERLPRATFVPAPGQGAIAMTIADSVIIELICDKLGHPRTRIKTTVERTILAELGGGCIAPVGVHALPQDEHVHVGVQVLTTDDSESIKTSRDLPVSNHANAARKFATTLRDRGTDQLVDAVREETEE